MSEKETNKEARKISRVAIRPTTEKILDEWRKELNAIFPAFSPSSSELVTWAVERTPVLSKRNIQEIRSLFFDEVKELETQLSQLKKVKASGDEDGLRALLQAIKGKKNSPVRGKRPQKSEDKRPLNSYT